MFGFCKDPYLHEGLELAVFPMLLQGTWSGAFEVAINGIAVAGYRKSNHAEDLARVLQKYFPRASLPGRKGPSGQPLPCWSWT